MAITKIYKGTNDITSTLTKAYKGNTLIWENTPPVQNYVRFVSNSPRNIRPKYTNSGVTLQYSIDSGTTWVNATNNVDTPEAQEIWFRGQATGTKSLYTSNTSTNAWVFTGSSINKVDVYGDLMYLLCDNLGDTTVSDFVDNNCFNNMFSNFTALRTAPELSATTLASGCYSYMFYTCPSLVKAPDLPATTLVPYCCSSMFYGCISLVSIRMLYTGVDTNITNNWVQNIATNGTLYKAGTQFTTQGNSTYPATWTQVQI